MRINPILNWTYADVWSFIRTLQVPYCVLYDQGYTSLGFKSRTKKNPELYLETRGKRDVYRPAYTLENGETERSARDWIVFTTNLYIFKEIDVLYIENFAKSLSSGRNMSYLFLRIVFVTIYIFSKDEHKEWFRTKSNLTNKRCRLFRIFFQA